MDGIDLSYSAVKPPLVAHIIDRLVVGGMENGLVNLINNTAPDRYRHAVVCLRYADQFRSRIRDENIRIYSLEKKAGKDVAVYARLWRCLKQLRPTIVHTRNLPTVDTAPVAAAAGIRWRVHGEHGRDVIEAEGDNLKYNALRRVMSPMIQSYIAVSRDLAGWLHHSVGVDRRKIRQIYNGVDNEKFCPPSHGRLPLPCGDFSSPDTVVIGTVGRLEPIKDQMTFVRAFIELCRIAPDQAPSLRFVMIGEGSLLDGARQLLREAGLEKQAWLPGRRDDIAELLRAIDVFVLPSINEGISNTIIEAMATGLPVVATDVGGNGEIVVDDVTGRLVPAQNPQAMAAALRDYILSPALRKEHGHSGRTRVAENFSLHKMVEGYLAVYDELLSRR